MSSKFGLYYFGYCLILAAQFLMKAIFAASRLGEPLFAIPVTFLTVFLPFIVLVVLDIIMTIFEASLKG